MLYTNSWKSKVQSSTKFCLQVQQTVTNQKKQLLMEMTHTKKKTAQQYSGYPKKKKNDLPRWKFLQISLIVMNKHKTLACLFTASSKDSQNHFSSTALQLKIDFSLCSNSFFRRKKKNRVSFLFSHVFSFLFFFLQMSHFFPSFILVSSFFPIKTP